MDSVPVPKRRRRRGKRPNYSEEEEEAITKKLKWVPKAAVNTFKRAYSGASKAAAVKAMCLECIGFIREEVRSCSAPTCPLWPYRPFRTLKLTEKEK